jgi:hypothetical protein
MLNCLPNGSHPDCHHRPVISTAGSGVEKSPCSMVSSDIKNTAALRIAKASFLWKEAFALRHAALVTLKQLP